MKPERRRFYCYQLLYLVPEDILAIGHAMKHAFPDLMFRSNHPYVNLTEESVRSPDGQREDLEAPTRLVPKPRVEWKTMLSHDPGVLLEEFWGCAWVVPQGWEPEWVLSEGEPCIFNQPELSAGFDRSSFFFSRTHRMQLTAPVISTDDEYVYLTEGRFGGAAWPWEEERCHFLSRCKTIIRKHTTACFVQIDPERKLIEYRRDKESPRDTRFGFHALEWARAHPRHYLSSSFRKPVDWTEPR